MNEKKTEMRRSKKKIKKKLKWEQKWCEMRKKNCLGKFEEIFRLFSNLFW